MVNYRNHDVGDIKNLVKFHIELYTDKYSFNKEFEDYGIDQLEKVMKKFDKEKDLVLIAEENDTIIGSIIVTHEKKNIAKLTWLNVKPEYKDQGIRRNLIKKALEFCKKKYKGAVLITYSLLDDAKQLYIEEGFRLKTSDRIYKWGQHLTKDLYTLTF